jgi:transcriptional regulator NrdR family protein
MKCPHCGAESRVIATRGNVRSRKCMADETHRFTTSEVVLSTVTKPRGRPPALVNQMAQRAGLQ